MKAPCPVNNDERLRALHRYGILDTAEESEFDHLTALAAGICGTPIAVINFIDRDRQWFKSEVGLGVRETPLDTSLCAHAILQEDVMVVPDTREDPRFNTNPLVTGEPHLEFYAGAAIRSPDGHPLGTVCVLDHTPRQLTDSQIDLLRVLARQVMQVLELRRQSRMWKRLNAELEDQLTKRRDLVATVAHDLRTPLSAISLLSRLLMRDGEGMQPELAKDFAEHAAIIRDSTDDMAQLIADLADFSSIDDGTLRISVEDCPLEAILGDLARRFACLAEEAGLALETDLDGDGAATLACDRKRVVQALGNLIANALKFTPRGGSVRVAATAGADEVTIAVEDTGRGMTSEELERVWDRHWSGVAGASRGRGLGLAIVEGITKAHGGRVSAVSPPGGGATITMTLPRHPAAVVAAGENVQARTEKAPRSR